MEQLKLLHKVDADVWYSDSKISLLHLAVINIRMVVVKLDTGGLWLHSPIQIDDQLFKEINSLGKVEHIVAPNCFHHLFASSAKARFPEAVLSDFLKQFFGLSRDLNKEKKIYCLMR